MTLTEFVIKTSFMSNWPSLVSRQCSVYFSLSRNILQWLLSVFSPEVLKTWLTERERDGSVWTGTKNLSNRWFLTSVSAKPAFGLATCKAIQKVVSGPHVCCIRDDIWPSFRRLLGQMASDVFTTQSLASSTSHLQSLLDCIGLL